MEIVETRGLTHRYGRVEALHGVELTVPAGSLCALLGPNGAGKTTLLRILMGLERPTAGEAWVLGKPVGTLTAADRGSIGYVAEGQSLPDGMTLARLEAYLAPLYPRWDAGLAAELRRRFRLESHRRIGSLSRGERMKAALLCALAPRPRLLILDEPFTGMDALVKDELVEGVLESSGSEGWTVLVSSHDLAELEMLADRVVFLDAGRLLLAEPMESLRERVRWVEVVGSSGSAPAAEGLPREWLAVERAGPRLRFLHPNGGMPGELEVLRRRFAGPARIEMRPASLREIFVALARARTGEPRTPEVVA